MQLIISLMVGKLFAFFWGVYYFRKLLLPYKFVLLANIIAMLCESYGYYLYHYLHQKNNLWLFNDYIITELWLMGLAAIFFLQNKTLTQFFSALMIGISVFWYFNVRAVSNIQFVGPTMTINCVVLTFMYIVVLYKNSLFTAKDIITDPVFWVCMPTILYFGCDIPIMGMHNYLSEKMPRLGTKLAVINSTLDIVRYPLTGISFILLGRRKNEVTTTVNNVL